jgi:3-polyprenyl-4-hydroxybenzoate decarboxylase
MLLPMIATEPLGLANDMASALMGGWPLTEGGMMDGSGASKKPTALFLSDQVSEKVQIRIQLIRLKRAKRTMQKESEDVDTSAHLAHIKLACFHESEGASRLSSMAIFSLRKRTP